MEASIVALLEPSAYIPSSRITVSVFSQRSSSVMVSSVNSVPSIPSVMVTSLLSDIVEISVPLFAVLVFFTEIRPLTVLSDRVVPVGSYLTFTTREFAAFSSTLYVAEVNIRTGDDSSSLI